MHSWTLKEHWRSIMVQFEDWLLLGLVWYKLQHRWHWKFLHIWCNCRVSLRWLGYLYPGMHSLWWTYDDEQDEVRITFFVENYFNYWTILRCNAGALTSVAKSGTIPPSLSSWDDAWNPAQWDEAVWSLASLWGSTGISVTLFLAIVKEIAELSCNRAHIGSRLMKFAEAIMWPTQEHDILFNMQGFWLKWNSAQYPCHYATLLHIEYLLD